MVEWITSNELVDFREAEAWMEERASLIAANRADECIWLVEHPPLYSAGTSAKIEDLTDPTRFPVFETGAADSTPTTAQANALST